jgi:hypothetical protein
MRVSALFGRMSAAVARIEAARNTASENAGKLDASDPLRKKLGDFTNSLDELKKKIVATKEGGAITGEERLREHADFLYGALMSWEGRPGKYQLARIDVLDHELSDVEKDLNSLFAKSVPGLDAESGKKHLEPIPTAAVLPDEELPSSGDLQRAFGLFFGRQMAPVEREERD